MQTANDAFSVCSSGSGLLSTDRVWGGFILWGWVRHHQWEQTGSTEQKQCCLSEAGSLPFKWKRSLCHPTTPLQPSCLCFHRRKVLLCWDWCGTWTGQGPPAQGVEQDLLISFFFPSNLVTAITWVINSWKRHRSAECLENHKGPTWLRVRGSAEDHKERPGKSLSHSAPGT